MTNKLEPAGVGKQDEIMLNCQVIFRDGFPYLIKALSLAPIDNPLFGAWEVVPKDNIKQLLADQRSLVINEVLVGLPKPKKQVVGNDDIHFADGNNFCETCGQYQYDDPFVCYCTIFNGCLNTVKQQLEGLNGGGK